MNSRAKIESRFGNHETYLQYLVEKACWTCSGLIKTHVSSERQRQCPQCRRKWSYVNRQKEWQILSNFLLNLPVRQAANTDGHTTYHNRCGIFRRVLVEHYFDSFPYKAKDAIDMGLWSNLIHSQLTLLLATQLNVEDYLIAYLGDKHAILLKGIDIDECTDLFKSMKIRFQSDPLESLFSKNPKINEAKALTDQIRLRLRRKRISKNSKHLASHIFESAARNICTREHMLTSIYLGAILPELQELVIEK